MVDISEEVWAPIIDFPDYQISNFGRVYNERLDRIMRTSLTNDGYVKITLVSSWDGKRYTRSVAMFVADRFVIRPSLMCDHVILLDGDLNNVAAHNIMWRPRWFAVMYARQMRSSQPRYYENLPVCDITTGVVYNNITEAGITLGLLFKDIWRSCNSGLKIYPDGAIFQVLQRV